MTMRISKLAGVLAITLCGAITPLAATADQAGQNQFVVSQDNRYFHGQLIRADLVPDGVRTITYAQYVAQQRSAGLQPRSLNQMRGITIAGTIGVFR